MKFSLKKENALFLKLAMKELQHTATERESDKLRKIMKETPKLRDEYRQICQEIQGEEDNKFLQLSLRVLFKKAKPKEIASVRALKQTEPTQWSKFLRVAFILGASGQISTIAQTKSGDPEPMPEGVRKRLLSELRQKRKKPD